MRTASLSPTPDHSDAEDRFVLLGVSSRLRLLVVVHCYKESESVTRIVSAQGRQARARDLHRTEQLMRKQYDFSKGVRNPYARKLKQPVTIRLDSQTVEYFKSLAERKGIPYQSLINLYLRDCAERRVELSMAWKASRQGAA